MRRCVAVLLLGIFLAAGTTLPGPDALLHHGPGSARELHRSHLEPAGGCGSHADACTLGRTASGAGAALAHAAVIRPESPAEAPGFARPRSSPDEAALVLLPPSRAPPLPIA